MSTQEITNTLKGLTAMSLIKISTHKPGTEKAKMRTKLWMTSLAVTPAILMNTKQNVP